MPITSESPTSPTLTGAFLRYRPAQVLMGVCAFSLLLMFYAISYASTFNYLWKFVIANVGVALLAELVTVGIWVKQGHTLADGYAPGAPEGLAKHALTVPLTYLPFLAMLANCMFISLPLMHMATLMGVQTLKDAAVGLYPQVLSDVGTTVHVFALMTALLFGSLYFAVVHNAERARLRTATASAAGVAQP